MAQSYRAVFFKILLSLPLLYSLNSLSLLKCSPLDYEYSIVLFLEYKGNKDFIVSDLEVPIPPNTSWQTSIIKNISLKPVLIIHHGANTFVRFRLTLSRFQPLNIKISGMLSLRSLDTPSSELLISFSHYLKSISSKFLCFIQPTKWWNYSDPVISRVKESIYKEITLRNATLKEVLDYLRRFVQRTLSYSKCKFRKGASKALVDKVGDCSEYSDVYIALARSLGIPARRVLGWVFMGFHAGKPILVGHAWAEILLPDISTWIPLETTFPSNVSINMDVGKLPENYIAFYIEDGTHDVNSPLVPEDESFLISSEEWIPLSKELWFSSSIIIKPKLEDNPTLHSVRILRLLYALSVLCFFVILSIVLCISLLRRRFRK